ncbi:MAG: hypothetical protein AAGI38_24605 [Bacteroidota bacterium]
MKPTFTSTILIVMILGLTSCQFVIGTFLGIKNPAKYRTEEKIRDFSVNMGLDTTHLYSVDSSALKTIYATVGTFPNMMIFDANGMYVPNPYDDSIGCTVEIEDFLGMLGNPQFPAPASTNQFMLKDQLKNLRTLSGESVDTTEMVQSDYYVLIFTGYSMGKYLNKKNTLKWQAQMEENGNDRFSYATVFVDYQDWWKNQ